MFRRHWFVRESKEAATKLLHRRVTPVQLVKKALQRSIRKTVELRRFSSWIPLVRRNRNPHLSAERTPGLQRSLRCRMRSVRLREPCSIARNVHVGHGSGYLPLRRRNVAHRREADEELDSRSLTRGLAHIRIKVSE